VALGCLPRLTGPSSSCNTRPSAIAVDVSSVERQRRADGGATMISVRTDRIIRIALLSGLLTATAACDLVADLRRAPAMPVAQAPARQSVPAATVSTPVSDARPAVMVTPDTPVATAAPVAVDSRAELQGPSRSPQPSATNTEQGSTDTEDPRAVIDWLLNRSSTR